MGRRKVAVKFKIRNKEAKLLEHIIDELGGLTAVGRKAGVSRQAVFYWKQAGLVPLTTVMNIAAKLKVKPLALNFKELRPMYPHISWSEISTDWRL